MNQKKNIIILLAAVLYWSVNFYSVDASSISKETVISKKQSKKKGVQKNYSVDHMLGFYRGKAPAPCGIQLGKTTKAEIIKKFKICNASSASSFISICPPNYKNYVILQLYVFFDENEVVNYILVSFDNDHYFDFVERIQNAGYHRVNYFHDKYTDGADFQQKEMPFEISVMYTLINTTNIEYRVMK